jgi:hypothetical protein
LKTGLEASGGTPAAGMPSRRTEASSQERSVHIGRYQEMRQFTLTLKNGTIRFDFLILLFDN